MSRTADGDTVLVEDGVYLESNIEITKRIMILSRNRFGAVIYGSERTQDAVFIIRAATRLEGYILKNAAAGIKQRHSPDVEWEVSNVVIYNCSIGISVDDPSRNIGSARIRNVAVFGRPESVGIATNDAGRIEVADCLIADCRIAFQGYDHLSFCVSGGAVLDCVQVAREATAHRPIPPAMSRVEIGGGLRVLRPDSLKGHGQLEGALGYLRTTVFGGRLPTGGHLEQADGSAWMAFFTQCMLELSLELALHDATYEDMALKLVEHFFWIAGAMDRVGDSADELWDEDDGFFYDVLRLPDGTAMRLQVRSLVGLLPLCATTVISQELLDRFPRALDRVRRFLQKHQELVANLPAPTPGVQGRRLLAVLNETKLRRVLTGAYWTKSGS